MTEHNGNGNGVTIPITGKLSDETSPRQFTQARRRACVWHLRAALSMGFDDSDVIFWTRWLAAHREIWVEDDWS